MNKKKRIENNRERCKKISGMGIEYETGIMQKMIQFYISINMFIGEHSTEFRKCMAIVLLLFVTPNDIINVSNDT